LTPYHQEAALSKLECVRPELLFDYVSKFNLTEHVDDMFFENLAKGYVEKGKFHEAALIVDRF
jgi:hypothetical protein